MLKQIIACFRSHKKGKIDQGDNILDDVSYVVILLYYTRVCYTNETELEISGLHNQCLLLFQSIQLVIEDNSSQLKVVSFGPL